MKGPFARLFMWRSSSPGRALGVAILLAVMVVLALLGLLR